MCWILPDSDRKKRERKALIMSYMGTKVRLFCFLWSKSGKFRHLLVWFSSFSSLSSFSSGVIREGKGVWWWLVGMFLVSVCEREGWRGLVFGVSTERVRRVNDGTLWEVFCAMRKNISRNRLTRGWHGRGCFGYEKTLTAWLSVRVLEIGGSLSGIWTRVTRMKTWRPDQTRRRDHPSFLTLQN